MTHKQIREYIAGDEGLHCEFKEAANQLPRNLMETVCAFLNTDGGNIFLGVADDGAITGVDPESVEKLKSDLANLNNNPQKITPSYILMSKEHEIDRKTVIAVQVPLSSQMHQTGGQTYLRNEDGDYRVQGNHQLAGLINRKLGLFTEQRAFPHYSMNNLRLDLFEQARRLMLSRNAHHPWANLSDEELLKFQNIQRGHIKYCLTSRIYECCTGKTDDLQ